MGQLKPGVQYVYERVGDTVYARIPGESERTVVGYNHRTTDGRPLIEHLREEELWGDIRRAAKYSPALQTELDRVIMLYYLSKDNDSEISHHPV